MTETFIHGVLAAGAGGVLVALLAPLTPQLRLLSGVVLIGLAASGFLSLGRRRPARAPALRRGRLRGVALVADAPGHRRHLARRGPSARAADCHR
ncbi:MAG TPA: hypothetical protein VNA04_07620, partial [Thermoanaerobaculia bacterium]|nr:hypothetical protein [Thermoanaerobaculia bacterium]